MDDLLIVRYSDGSRGRQARRSANAPMGANLGIVAGASFGLMIAVKYEFSLVAGLVLGIGCGVALGAAFGRFIAARHRPARISRPVHRHFDGFPMHSDDEDNAESPDSPNASQ